MDLLDEVGVIHDGGGGADQGFLKGVPRQQTAKDIESTNGFAAHGFVFDTKNNFENKGIDRQQDQGMDDGPEEPHGGADVAGLDIAAEKFPEQVTVEEDVVDLSFQRHSVWIITRKKG